MGGGLFGGGRKRLGSCADTTSIQHTDYSRSAVFSWKNTALLRCSLQAFAAARPHLTPPPAAVRRNVRSFARCRGRPSWTSPVVLYPGRGLAGGPPRRTCAEAMPRRLISGPRRLIARPSRRGRFGRWSSQAFYCVQYVALVGPTADALRRTAKSASPVFLSRRSLLSRQNGGHQPACLASGSKSPVFRRRERRKPTRLSTTPPLASGRRACAWTRE